MSEYAEAKGYEIAVKEVNSDMFIAICERFKEQIKAIGINTLNIDEITVEKEGLVHKRTLFFKIDCDKKTFSKIKKLMKVI